MLLSICIPTYNRFDELKNTVNSLNVIINKLNMENDVEIIISDNSDFDVAVKNEMFGRGYKNVRYSKNTKNIGFSGNLVKVVSMAAGDYFWIVPDNDDFFEEGLETLLTNMTIYRSCETQCIFVPFLYQSFNLVEVLGSNYGEGELRTLLEAGELPFILLSAAIIKNKKNDIEIMNLTKKFEGNSFIQIPLILKHISLNSKYVTLKQPVVKYNVEYNGRFKSIECFDSMITLLDYLREEYSLELSERYKKEYVSFCRTQIASTTGIFNVVDSQEARKHAFKKISPKLLSKRSLIMLLLMIMPSYFQRKLYITWSIISALIIRKNEIIDNINSIRDGK